MDVQNSLCNPDPVKHIQYRHGRVRCLAERHRAGRRAHSRLYRCFGGYACRTGNLAGGDGLGAAFGALAAICAHRLHDESNGDYHFVLVYGRMLEIYLLTSLAPIPVATLSNRELGGTGQNYIKSLFAVGFQGLLILVCVAIYAVLIQASQQAAIPLGRFGELWATRFCFASCSLRPGALPAYLGAHLTGVVLMPKKIRGRRNALMEWKNAGGVY